MVFNVDQNPKFAGISSQKECGVSPCIRPTGKYFVYDRMSFLSAREMAALQGFSGHDLEQAVGDRVNDDRFLANLVGNGFATTTFAATLVVALMSWTRQLYHSHNDILISSMN